jgi:hypothetical protein
LQLELGQRGLEKSLGYMQERALPQEVIGHASASGFRLFYRYTSQLDHWFVLEDNDNPQIRPKVFRMMGGEIIAADDPLMEHPLGEPLHEILIAPVEFG